MSETERKKENLNRKKRKKKRKEKERKEKKIMKERKKKEREKKERKKGLLYRILIVQVSTTLDTCRVNRSEK